MREPVNEFVKICSKHLQSPDPIYEFGSYQVPGQEHISNLRCYYPNKKYYGADMREGPGVDVILNLHQIDLPDASAGTLLMLDTIEHVEYPRKAMDEIHRILKPGGILLMSSVMCFPIHDYPHDYWRFTPEAFRSLLKPFERSLVAAAGDTLFPHTVIGIGFKAPVENDGLETLQNNLDEWQIFWTAALRPKGFKRFLKYLGRLDDKIKNAVGKE